MEGPPIDITSGGDSLMWIGLAILGVLGLVALIAPRWLRHAPTGAS